MYSREFNLLNAGRAFSVDSAAGVEAKLLRIDLIFGRRSWGALVLGRLRVSLASRSSNLGLTLICVSESLAVEVFRGVMLGGAPRFPDCVQQVYRGRRGVRGLS